METELTTFAINNGFAVVMCAWFMIRTEKVINNNTEALNNFKIKQKIK